MRRRKWERHCVRSPLNTPRPPMQVPRIFSDPLVLDIPGAAYLTQPGWLLRSSDCLGLFLRLVGRSIDLIFANLPFNIGYDYDIRDERREAQVYLGLTRDWGRQVMLAL